MKKKEHSDAILERLFDAEKRVRVIKFFIRNGEASFSARDVAGRLRMTSGAAKEHLNKLVAVGLLSARRFKKGALYQANPAFVLFEDIKHLVVKVSPYADDTIAKKLQRVKGLKLAVIAGVFLNDPSSRVDLLLVGDGMLARALRTIIQDLESRTGKEINYTTMGGDEYKYRSNMNDRFIKDIFEHAHKVVVDKLK